MEYGDEQITTEEDIAAYLFAKFRMTEDEAAQAGRDILRLVAHNLTPDEYGEIYDYLLF